MELVKINRRPKPGIHPEHQRLENHVYDTLKKKPWIRQLEQDLSYPWGQLDVYARVGNRHIYYEVKKSYTNRTIAKTEKQGIRWLQYQSRMYPKHRSYVVMVTTNKMKIIARYIPK